MQPTPPTSFGANHVVVDDRIVRVATVVESPALVVLDGVLSNAECAALVADAGRRMSRSLVIDRDNVDGTEDLARSSSGTFFEPGASGVADEIQRRLISIIGLPPDHGEPLQVLRYSPGDRYEPHFDYFDVDEADDGAPAGDDRPTESTVVRHGQRVATLICYLSDVAVGGATVFPEIGLEVRPVRGRAVYFTYVDAKGRVDPTSLHGGAPVDEGEKWIVTQWCRERPYRQTPPVPWPAPKPATASDA